MIVLIVVDGVLAEHLAHWKKRGLKAFGRLFKRSSWTLQAKTQYPCLTEPSIAALMHGTDVNFFRTYYDNCKDYGTYINYPSHIKSVFEILYEQNKRSVMIGTWKGLTQELCRPGFCIDNTEDSAIVGIDTNVTIRTINWLKMKDNNISILTRKQPQNYTSSAKLKTVIKKTKKEKEPTLLFVYFENVDHIAHESGFSKEYDRALVTIDQQLEIIINTLSPSDYLILTADHGRLINSVVDDTKKEKKNGCPLKSNYDGVSERDHHFYTEQTTSIPLFIIGPNIVNQKLEDDISIIDIAPTILSICNVDIPRCMRGRPINLTPKL